jgi:hypothetical protein
MTYDSNNELVFWLNNKSIKNTQNGSFRAFSSGGIVYLSYLYQHKNRIVTTDLIQQNTEQNISNSFNILNGNIENKVQSNYTVIGDLVLKEESGYKYPYLELK